METTEICMDSYNWFKRNINWRETTLFTVQFGINNNGIFSRLINYD